MSWWPFQRPGRRPAVILYTRAGCHLCHAVAALLEAERAAIDFDLRLVDIDQDAELRQRYDLEVPVVSIDGRDRFRGAVNAVLFRRELRAAAR